MTKSELRKAYKTRRATITNTVIDELSIAIANQTLTLPIWNKSYYSLFLSIEKLKEVNTQFLLHILQGRDKNVVVSKSDFSTLQMHHFLLTDATRLQLNSWGIPEPVEGIPIAPKNIEVVFLPLLAFDEKGNRIGYGKGFYDRFLSNCKPDIIKVGLSFFKAEETLIKAGEKDIPLDFCVTPEKVYCF